MLKLAYNIYYTFPMLQLPDISTKLVYDINIPKEEVHKSLTGKEIDLRDSFGQKIKVWRRIWRNKLLCIWKENGKKKQYVFELENISGNNRVVWAINKWIFAKEYITRKENKWKEFHFHESVFYSKPRLYDIRFNKDLFKLNLRFAKLTEMGRDILQEKKRKVKRIWRIHTILRSKWYIDKLTQFSYEKTLETDGEVVEKIVNKVVKMCVETELHPPKPIEPPFYFRTAQIMQIGDHLLKLTKQRGQEEKNIIWIDALTNFLEDNFEEIVTKEEVEEILAKMKRKIRKIAREFWKKQNLKD